MRSVYAYDITYDIGYIGFENYVCQLESFYQHVGLLVVQSFIHALCRTNERYV